MKVKDLLYQLSSQGVELWVEGEALCYRAPKGVLTSTWRAQLTKHKAEILKYLAHQNERITSTLPQIVPDPDQRYLPFPLTDIQTAYLIGRAPAFELGNVAAHIYLEMEGTQIDLNRLNIALNRVIARHDMLRAIVQPDGKQRILEQVPPYTLKVFDLRQKTPQERRGQLDRLRQLMSHQILPPDQWPLFEICISRLDQQRTRLHASFDLTISDAWGARLFRREWLQLYENPDATLPPLELSFRDYVLATQSLRNSSLYERSRDYWLRRLPSLPAAPELPLAKSTTSITQPQFVRRQGKLEPQIWLELKQRATQAGLTPSGILCAAFAEVLATWSKNTNFTLNLTLFNRLPLHPQVNEIIGDFTTTLLLAVNRTASTFKARSQCLQQQIWEDLDYTQMSGVEVLRELLRSQERATKAIMPVVFTSLLVKEPIKAIEFGFFEEVYGISQTPQVWLDHQVYEVENTLFFNWDAVEDLFPPGLLDDMFTTYCQFLEQLADSQAIWETPFLSLVPSSQLQLQLNLNATTTPQSSQLLHTLFTRQVPQRPHQPAVIAPNLTLTYQELNQRAAQIAYQLRTLGALPNQLVAIVMEPGWEQVVAVLAILQAGAAYLPLDPHLPPERLEYLLRNGEVQLVLTQSWLQRSLPWPVPLELLAVDSLEGQVALSTSPLEPLPQPEDLAYVIYTSGSTGEPKGVMIEHQGAVNTIVDLNRRLAIEPTDRILALSALNFDLSVYDFFGALAAGGTIVMPEACRSRDPAHWADLIAQHQVTLWNSVPALMQMLIDYHQDSQAGSVGDSLRLVLLSGDWIPLTLPEAIRCRIGEQVKIISLGGATEASIWSIYYPIEQVNPSWQSIPYGRPLDNQRFYVLDEALQPRPTWVTGQLYIGGLGLARGYWRDQAKTQNSFIIHPQTGERLYRTGDLGYYLADGTIAFLGREDSQVKLQGYRVELGEIETVLGQHPGVRQSVVVAVESQSGSRQLAAYMIPQPGETPAREELRNFLLQKLPRYMVPSSFSWLEALPLTSNGKVDRKALPAPEMAGVDLSESFVAPRTPIERKLTSLWKQVLGIEQLGIYNNFFELGGNSLQLTQLITLVREAFQVELSLKSFLENPTVIGLARVIDSDQPETVSNLSPATSISDLKTEAILEPSIDPAAIPVKPTLSAPSHIFLTGATGFLGTFLLNELLQQTRAVIYCLVRAPNAEAGKKKLHDKLKFYSLWQENYISRIIPVIGDLSRLHLGLSDAQFQAMADLIDVIYHNGALVNFIYPYSALKATNVLATQEILRLASQIKVKPVHFISTVAVFSSIGYDEVRRIQEQDSIDDNIAFSSGYAQSKWVAEKLVATGGERGIPISIYRPGMISGHSQTGISSMDDFLSTMIRGCIQMGRVPALDIKIDMTPVDYVSQAIVYLSRQETSLGKAFHLVNPQPPHLSQLSHWTRAFGYPLQEIPYSEWCSQLVSPLGQSLPCAFTAFVPLLLDQEQIMNSARLEFDCRHTLERLSETTIVCPSITAKILHTQFSYFIQHSFIDVPSVGQQE